jgi:hypothetical protein
MESKTETQTVESPIFGVSVVPTYTQYRYIVGIVENCPFNVFQELNKLLNKRGYKLSILKLEE